MIFFREILLITLFSVSMGDTSDGSGNEKWGYVDIRKNAHEFWWLHLADDYQNKPLVVWLQGGPGAGGTGYGNFLEIGPLDENFNPRNTTWLNQASLLFIDNPVGAGFSYVDDKSALTNSTTQIADDLLVTLTSIFNQVPELQERPLYIFGESYGGKYTAVFAPLLYRAIKDGKIKCNFKGVGFGDSWISPPDFADQFANYLYYTSFLDDPQLDSANAKAKEVQRLVKSKQYRKATQKYLDLYDLLGTYTNFVDYYDIRRNTPVPAKGELYNTQSQIFRFLTPYGAEGLTSTMNTDVREKLKIIPDNVKWGGQTTDVMTAMFKDFMKPVYSYVSEILKFGDISVTVYNGQLDALVSTPGVLQWVHKLKWDGLRKWQQSDKNAMLLSGNRTGGFVKTYKQFDFFWFLNAGHLIPNETPEAAYNMLKYVLSR